MDVPEPRFVQTPEGHIAYQIVGGGPPDLVLVPNWLTNLDVMWEDPPLERYLRRLASFSRLLLIDKRGSGISDPLPLDGRLNMEDSAQDLRWVLDDVGSDSAALLGIEQGGLPAMLFAATFPSRTHGLILLDSSARFVRDADYAFGMPGPVFEKFTRGNIERYGTGGDLRFIAPELFDDERFRRWYARFERLSITRGTYHAFNLSNIQWPPDVRAILPSIRTPTLILHHQEHRWTRPEHGRYLADNIPNARYVEMPGESGVWWRHDADRVIDEVETFLTGSTGTPSRPDRVLTTVLFTDIVGSTERAVRLGDARWRTLLDAHDAASRRQIDRFRGELVKTTGDGVLATFDGPARAVRCALAIREEIRTLGVEVRSGVHTGEVERRDQDVGGVGVHIAQRVQSMAEPDEILVSRTVVDLVAGSGLEFDERGGFHLKGIPGEWQLFVVR